VKHLIKINGISVCYGDREVLSSLDAEFERGKLYAVVGVNGCGKSTLLRAMAGIIPHSRGEIEIDGDLASALTRLDLARRIAYLPQTPRIPDMTVMQAALQGRFPYLSYPRRYSAKDREIARAAVARVGLLERADEELRCLSGGARQSAYIAMALAEESDYILLDEPTNHLDISHQMSLTEMLRSLASEGRGIVAVMHDLPLAFRSADEVLLLDGGKIAARGAPRELCSSPAVSKAFGVGLRYLEDANEYIYER